MSLRKTSRNAPGRSPFFVTMNKKAPVARGRLRSLARYYQGSGRSRINQYEGMIVLNPFLGINS